jgi:hypothetical protein
MSGYTEVGAHKFSATRNFVQFVLKIAHLLNVLKVL